MYRLSLFLVLMALSACRTHTPAEFYGEELRLPQQNAAVPKEEQSVDLKTMLSMGRPIDELGYAEKNFNSCNMGAKDSGENTSQKCGDRYLTVVHLQLLCRDTEGTVTDAPVGLEPIVADAVKWQVGDQKGNLNTDNQGYGQLTMVSANPLKDQRLTLRIGEGFVGFTVSEVSKVILPKNFCRKRA